MSPGTETKNNRFVLQEKPAEIMLENGINIDGLEDIFELFIKQYGFDVRFVVPIITFTLFNKDEPNFAGTYNAAENKISIFFLHAVRTFYSLYQENEFLEHELEMNTVLQRYYRDSWKRLRRVKKELKRLFREKNWSSHNLDVNALLQILFHEGLHGIVADIFKQNFDNFFQPIPHPKGDLSPGEMTLIVNKLIRYDLDVSKLEKLQIYINTLEEITHRLITDLFTMNIWGLLYYNQTSIEPSRGLPNFTPDESLILPLIGSEAYSFTEAMHPEQLQTLIETSRESTPIQLLHYVLETMLTYEEFIQNVVVLEFPNETEPRGITLEQRIRVAMDKTREALVAVFQDKLDELDKLSGAMSSIKKYERFLYAGVRNPHKDVPAEMKYVEHEVQFQNDWKQIEIAKYNLSSQPTEPKSVIATEMYRQSTAKWLKFIALKLAYLKQKQEGTATTLSFYEQEGEFSQSTIFRNHVHGLSLPVLPPQTAVQVVEDAQSFEQLTQACKDIVAPWLGWGGLIENLKRYGIEATIEEIEPYLKDSPEFLEVMNNPDAFMEELLSHFN
jgi:hypothetical protein